MNREIPYLLINGLRVDIRDVAEKVLGLQNGPDMPEGHVPSVALCVDVDAGILVATPENSSNEYPCIELSLRPRKQDEPEILLARAEQATQTAAYKPTMPEVYLYGRGDSYIAAMPVDIRPDEIVEANGIENRILVSGDPGETVHVAFENRYYHIDGEV